MQTRVAIIGGGLAGLYAGKLLQQANIDFILIEARERLGGRILSADPTGSPSDDGFDLGPSWFWPEMQPAMQALVLQLGLGTFPQHSEGDVVFQRMSRETPLRYRPAQQEAQSMRIAGGTGSLVRALARQIPGERILTGAPVQHLELSPAHVTLKIPTRDAAEEVIVAEQVIAALPPRLLANIAFTPAIDAAALQRWKATPTWMAPHAKFFAIYDRPFWRAAGFSGTAQSLAGPLAEIHDATTASGKAALFGFPALGADTRAAMGDAALKQACLDQLARLFGPSALKPQATVLKDWAADPLTAAAEDRSGGGHPEPSSAPWVTGAWRDRLTLGGSEASPTEPGYMAGAVIAAERAAAEVMKHLNAAVEPGR
ncbi:MAG: flavin monoamine oxidase family protein [Acidobacteriota bacterium]